MPNRLTQVLNRICFMVSIPLVSIIHVILNTYRPNVHNLKTIIDDIIPFKEAFVVPYIYWFFYIPIVLFYFAIVDYKYYFRLLMSIIAGMFVCFIIYYFYPTTVVRPAEVAGNDVFSWLVRDFIYKKDNPYNCFPSIHVLNSVLVTLFFCKFNKNSLLKALAILSCVSISLSTLFIKQHYVADMVASMLLGTSMFVLFTNDSLWNSVPVKKVVDFLIPPKFRNFYID